MSQNARVIDITQSFVPIDPQSLDDNLGHTQKEDYPKKTETVVAFEGINFLPTGQGYKSYFGTTTVFDIPVCPAGETVDRVLVVEMSDYTNYFVVLADTGVYVNDGATASDWVQVVDLDAPGSGIHLIWTTVVIGNVLYMYRQGDPSYYTLPNDFDGSTELDPVTPTFLNMEGQIGIYKAGGRLGFWDSDNSTSWSSIDDLAEFTPDLETLAGSVIFSEVRGKITMITPYGDGFIIYATGSIVVIFRDMAATFQWTPKVLMNGNGVAYPEQVCYSSPDTTQFAYTSIGLHKIEGASAGIEVIATPITDLLKESLEPVTVKLLENRYLVLNLAESTFVEGNILLYSKTYSYTGITKVVTDLDLVPAFSDDDAVILPSLEQLVEHFDSPEVWRYFETGQTTDHQAMGAAAVEAAIIADPTLPTPIDEAFYIPLWSYALKARGNNVVESNGDIRFSKYYTGAECATLGLTSDPADYSAINNIDFVNNGISHNEVVTQDTVNVEGIGSARDFLIHGIEGYIASNVQTLAALNALGTNISTYDAISANGFANSWLSQSTEVTMSSTQLRLMETYEIEPEEGAEWTTSAHLTDAGIEYYEQGTYNVLQLVGWRYYDDDGVSHTIAVDTTSGVDVGTDVDWSQELPYDLYQFQTFISAADVLTIYPWTANDLDIQDIEVVLQQGSPGPVYPDYLGFLVYDLHLKKWGKCKATYKQLVDLSPINTNQGAIVTTKRAGINAGTYTVDGYITRFNDHPEESYITYGKIGMYRLGLTAIEEVNIDFRTPSTGEITVLGSLDGRNIEYSQQIYGYFEDATWYNLGVGRNAKWHCIKISGKYDITHLDYSGLISGRR